MLRSINNVLLVDDEPEICMLLSAMLRRNGAQCFSAHTLEEAKKVVASGLRFDAAFLDANLPDGMGYTLIPAIKSHSPDSACVAISAMDTEGANAEAAGADTFVAKPLSRQAIMDALRKLGFNT